MATVEKMQRMKKDLLVIGAGLVGGSVAWHAAAKGRSVCLLDKGRAGAEASWASAGVLAEITGAATPPPLGALCAQALAYYPEFVASKEQGICNSASFSVASSQA